MRILSWNEFNLCVEKISDRCKYKKFTGVYGIPRGGLCLAVAISHSLKIPFLDKPKPGSLIVDDVYETGLTLSTFRQIPDITIFVWLSKSSPEWWEAVEFCDPEQWLVFPWEDQESVDKDKINYQNDRYQ